MNLSSSTVRVSSLVVLSLILSLLGKMYGERRLQELNQAKFTLEPLQASYQGDSLKKLSLGLDNFIASLLWVRLLQGARHDKAPKGRVTWEYAQADAITTLDRKFERGYSYGAVYLSVFRGDALGAKLLLQKWTRQFPLSWHAHYLLGYHLAFEMDNPQAAAPEMLMASNLEGSPPFLKSIGIRLLSENGILTQALQVAIELYVQSSDTARELVAKRIRSIRFALEKSDLESAMEAYEKRSGGAPRAFSDFAALAQTPTRDITLLKTTDEYPEELKELLTEKFPFGYDPGKKEIISKRSMEELGLDIVGIHKKD